MSIHIIKNESDRWNTLHAHNHKILIFKTNPSQITIQLKPSIIPATSRHPLTQTSDVLWIDTIQNEENIHA